LLIFIFWAHQSSAMVDALKYIKDNKYLYITACSLVACVLLTLPSLSEDELEPLVSWVRCPEISIDDIKNMIESHTWPSGAPSEFNISWYNISNESSVNLSREQLNEKLGNNDFVWEDPLIMLANAKECLYGLLTNTNSSFFIKFASNPDCSNF